MRRLICIGLGLLMLGLIACGDDSKLLSITPEVTAGQEVSNTPKVEITPTSEVLPTPQYTRRAENMLAVGSREAYAPFIAVLTNFEK